MKKHEALIWKCAVISSVLMLFAWQLSQAQVLTTLYGFKGPPTDGPYPTGSLILDSQGNLFGTSAGFGANGGVGGDCTGNGECGAVFKVTPEGVETTLHFFTKGGNSYPMSGFIPDSKGDFYGTTHGTGAHQRDGTVFRLSKQKNLKVLYSFRGSLIHTGDGAFPDAGVVIDSEGTLYGTTYDGGAYNSGALFKLSAEGTETILHSFGGNLDGVYPEGPVFLDSLGNLYGTTLYTEQDGVPLCCGTVYKVTSSGAEIVVHQFAGSSDGAWPYGGLVTDSQGNLYGTTSEGGGSGCNNSGCGTVFKLTPSGTESILYRFSGFPDGAAPYAGLVIDSGGKLYGTTVRGGSNDYGTVFELTPTGSESVLYSFCSEANCTDGIGPEAPLTLDQSGNLYGTTVSVGVPNCLSGGGCGTVFKLTP
jgi:uncharacterized repeat protein (TIGR03803 family)